MEKPLPVIPAKRYFTIGEVSELCGVKPYVLRYWEQEFTQLKPMKRRGNRRYYQRHEVLLIRRIRELLYDEGFTISGARNRLADTPFARASDTDWDDGDGDGAAISDRDRGALVAEAPPAQSAPGTADGSSPLPAAALSSPTLRSTNAAQPVVAHAAAVQHSAKASMPPPLISTPMATDQLRDELLSIRELLSL